MKKAIKTLSSIAFLLAFVFFVIFYAKMQQDNLKASLPVAGRVVELTSVPTDSDTSGDLYSASQHAKIHPEWDETFLDAIDMNLDEDEDLEQVLTVKPSSSDDGKLSIVIADFQPTTGSYIRLWKGGTLAVKPNTIVVQPRDLLGDGSLELLCFGVDEVNRQTLTIFKRLPRGPEAYDSVFSESGVSLAIIDPSDTGFATIEVFEKAADGPSPLDQTKVVYSWGKEKFEIPGENIEQAFMSSILTGRAEDFELYLDGLWIKEGEATGQPTSLSFDAEGRKISIHSEAEQQQWDWGRSTAAFAGIYAPISNSAVPEMLRLLGIDLVGIDRVRVRATAQQIVKFAMREDWNGVYRRVDSGDFPLQAKGTMRTLTEDSLFQVAFDGSKAKATLRRGDFDGFYAGADGIRLDLAESRFRLEQKGEFSKGYFSIFQVGDTTILDLSLIDDSSIPSGRLSYIIHVRSGKNRRVGSLVLKPARILADTAEPLYKPDLTIAFVGH
ncbi:MAG: hypothetical protein CVV53_02860 [Spirochaetae bacterium HGW-Spirochaetae-9]|nr:MAG: hypothetical protein CVV53_02860 [Spirochaetae bacterium HGW-Spirochaetae-9]